ncbi:glycosyltransferase family 4 protein [Pseudobythopirellula maris]|uniref:glycosyltransferase family 4 protein n=1 Tax=Pseudobythopirellula maris TaxID=2527991 RepID=UPI0018D463EF|nr:glycosyltransferase family 4 protein [Pseudobythopirellula maris]
MDRRLRSSGGAQKYLVELTKALELDGLKVHALINEGDELQAYCKSLQDAGAQLHRFPLGDKARRESEQAIAEKLLELRPAGVHVNGSSNALDAVLEPVLGGSRGGFFKTFTIHQSLLNESLYYDTRLKGKIPYSYRRRTIRSARRYMGLYDAFISVSHVNMGFSVESLGIDESVVRYIPNGVDIGVYSPSGRGAGEVVFGSCSTLSPYKNHELLIRAFAKSGVSAYSRLRIAGDGQEAGMLRSVVQELGLQERVEFAGHQANVPDFLRSIDVFCMSSDSEGMPYSQLEAMSTGLPSIVTDVGDLAVVVRDGVDGYVVAPGDLDGYARSMAMLCESSVLRRNMGEGARRRAIENYSSQCFISKTQHFFAQMVSGRRRASAL